MEFNFSKWHGIGNDFVLFYGYREDEFDYNQLAQKICDRHFGVGADGLVGIFPSDTADFKMRIFNPDGSEAEMCGNVTRCVARYLYENKIVTKESLTLETLAGIIAPEIILEAGKVLEIKVDMGEPRLTRGSMSLEGDANEYVVKEALYIEGKTYLITCVSMGNPHCVIFTDDLETIPLEEVGPLIETHPFFPHKTNVEFVQVLDESTIRMRVWERGAGVTYACGTGACASLVAAVLSGETKREAVVKLDGGDLTINWQEDTNRVLMTGPAQEVFRGVYLI
jgi:diaminopimelate epimerase